MIRDNLVHTSPPVNIFPKVHESYLASLAYIAFPLYSPITPTK